MTLQWGFCVMALWQGLPTILGWCCGEVHAWWVGVVEGLVSHGIATTRILHAVTGGLACGEWRLEGRGTGRASCKTYLLATNAITVMVMVVCMLANGVARGGSSGCGGLRYRGRVACVPADGHVGWSRISGMTGTTMRRGGDEWGGGPEDDGRARADGDEGPARAPSRITWSRGTKNSQPPHRSLPSFYQASTPNLFVQHLRYPRHPRRPLCKIKKCLPPEKSLVAARSMATTTHVSLLPSGGTNSLNISNVIRRNPMITLPLHPLLIVLVKDVIWCIYKNYHVFLEISLVPEVIYAISCIQLVSYLTPIVKTSRAGE
ncbi:hypothetical protein EDB89DRAFT_1911943 [Lactarius sanguifluus]|nr:hypothetical protein EDB89DRAFT_1911943 [Lactarius sanguifluus]